MSPSPQRLSSLAVMVLALLREADMHPYEMARLLRHRRDDRLVTVSNGALYHTVSRLEERGFISEVGVDRDGNRPERTTYTLEGPGRDAVIDWVRRELGRIDRPAEFRIALAEAHNLPRAEVVALLRSRCALLAADDAAHRDGLDGARGRGIPEQFLVEIDRQSALITAELAWLDAFIQRMDGGDIPWGIDEIEPRVLESLAAQNRTLLT